MSSPATNLSDYLNTTADLLNLEGDTDSYVGRAQSRETLHDLSITLKEAGAAEANAWRQVLDYESYWVRRLDLEQLLALHRLIFTCIVAGIRFGRRELEGAYSVEEGREQLDDEFQHLNLEPALSNRLGTQPTVN